MLADNTNRHSLANLFRQRRHSFFLELLSCLDRPITILDVGGTEDYWKLMGLTSPDDFSITLLNIHDIPLTARNIKNVIGDARKMNFEDKRFDVIFSNSVIEHVGGFEDQKRMAEEVKRVGKRYFLQTPNKYFPLEPHFMFPFFQFLPISIRIWLLRHSDLGWFVKTPDPREAKAIVEGIRLLDKKELLELFPDTRLYKEMIFGVTKSFVVYDGWEVRDG